MTTSIVPRQENVDAREVWARISGFLSRKSQSTRRSYTTVLREYLEFLGYQIGDPEAATALVSADALTAQAYLTWLQKRPGQRSRYYDTEIEQLPDIQRGLADNDGTLGLQSNRTINRKASTLRCIYKVLQAHALIGPINPFSMDVTAPPPADSGQKRPTEMIPFDQVMRMVDLPNCEDIKGMRDRAILAILFGGGLRRSEVTRLRLADIKRNKDGKLYLLLRATKGKRDAFQALPDWSEERLAEWYDYRRQQVVGPASYLFTRFTGKGGSVQTDSPMHSDSVYQMFIRYAKQLDLHDHVTPHSARATAITRLLDAGLTHREVQDFSRHKSVAMVETYDKRRKSVDESPARMLEF